MPRPHSSIALLLDLIDEAFDHAAWHGPTLRGSLRGVTAEQASWRPMPTRHNIRELTVHAAYWKYAVRRRLVGTTRGSFAMPGSNWFEIQPGRSWKDDVLLLTDEHRQLRAAVAAYPASKLSKPIDAKKQTAAFSIRGIAAHDLYHAGQIQLLKKIQKGGWGR
jgi:DinB superfamily